jgi:hypothetical protein
MMKREGKGDSASPVCLADLDREGKLLWLYCQTCGHEAEVAPTSLPLPTTYPVPEVGKRMVCSQCQSRAITSAPELHPGGVFPLRARYERNNR